MVVACHSGVAVVNRVCVSALRASMLTPARSACLNWVPASDGLFVENATELTQCRHPISSFTLALVRLRLVHFDGFDRGHSSTLGKVYADDLDILNVRKSRSDN